MRTRSQSVTDQLREMIINGELEPGLHLQEQPCADMLEVSRTPVRAALSTLANEGYLDYKPKRGYIVRGFKPDDLLDAWQMRAWLEGLAALRAAERGVDASTEAQMRALVADADRILAKGALDPDDLEPYRQINSSLHALIMAAADSPRLEQAIRQTLSLPMVSDRIIPWNDYEHIRRSHDDHHRLVDAIVAGEAWRAEALMREHIFAGSKRLGAQAKPGASAASASGPASEQSMRAAGLARAKKPLTGSRKSS